MIKDFFNAVICMAFHRNLKIISDRNYEHIVVCSDCDIKDRVVNLRMKNIFLTNWYYKRDGISYSIRNKIMFILALAHYICTKKQGVIEDAQDNHTYAFTSDELLM